MLNSNKIRFGFYSLLLFVLSVGAAAAQNKEKYKNYEFCSDNWNWSDNSRVSSKDLREIKLDAGGLTVDGKRNGGISVKGENRADILVRACVQTWAATQAEADALAKQVRIETGGGNIRAEGLTDEKNWGVSYEILVPRNTNLSLTTYNGGISIENIDAVIEFDAKNGGINLSNLAGDVKGKTTNGGLHVELGGNSWKGNGLNVETTNGGVHLTMAENYAAHFETRTVNGGFVSDIAALAVEKDRDDNGYRKPGVNISKDINGGGALVRIVTTNGGVRIGSN